MISPFYGKFKLTSPRGYRILNGEYEYHKGIDLVGIDSNEVKAIADGTVYTLYEENGFGYYVRQHLSDGRRIYYGHLSTFKVQNVTKVNKGDVLGIMGASGKVTGTHTHLELRPEGYGSESIDICDFTGIPNKVGVYEYKGEIMKHFKDIEESFAKNDIEELCEMGIINGTSEGNFEPKRNATREEIAAMLRRTIKYITGK